jgi:hypothetical protein
MFDRITYIRNDLKTKEIKFIDNVVSFPNVLLISREIFISCDIQERVGHFYLKAKN